MSDCEGRTDCRYRLEVEGELADEWSDWFNVAALRTEGGRTVMELEVADQAQLHAALRRIHDLHLPLVSLIRLPPHRPEAHHD